MRVHGLIISGAIPSSFPLQVRRFCNPLRDVSLVTRNGSQQFLTLRRLSHFSFVFLETTSLDFTHYGFLITSPKNVVVKLPWSMSVMFRTLENTGVVMEVMFSSYVSYLQVRWTLILNRTSPSFTLVISLLQLQDKWRRTWAPSYVYNVLRFILMLPSIYIIHQPNFLA